MNYRPSLPAAILLVVSVPVAAEAHPVTTGLGPLFDGAIHLLTSPDDLLGLMAVMMLAGLHGARACRLAVITLPIAWLSAGLVGLGLPIGIELPWLRFLSLVAIGALVAANPPLSPIVVAVVACLFGALRGLFNGSALAATGAGPLSMIGIAGTVLIVGGLCSAWIVSLRATWTRIAVRVAGSWVAAVGMLMLGWLFRGTG